MEIQASSSRRPGPSTRRWTPVSWTKSVSSPTSTSLMSQAAVLRPQLLPYPHRPYLQLLPDTGAQEAVEVPGDDDALQGDQSDDTAEKAPSR